MSQNKLELPLDLTIKSSKIVYYYLISIFVLSLISIVISDSLHLYTRLLLIFVLSIGIVFTLRKNSSTKVSHLILSSENNFVVTTRDNNRYEVELTGECIVTYFLVWLNFKTVNNEQANKRFHLLLLPDSADRQQLRQLRVRLRFISNSKAEEPTQF